MQRRRPNDDELNNIIKLKQSGASWLEIQRETTIPRRTVKLAYEAWERQQSMRELMQVRREVAADEFRRHIDRLTRFSAAFLDNLSVRGAPAEMSSADAALDEFWRRDVFGEHGQGNLHAGLNENNDHRNMRQNLMLFKALNEHTRGAIRWEHLDKWKDSWNQCAMTLMLLQKQGRELLDSYLMREPALREKVDMGRGATDALELMLGGLLWAIWQAVRFEKYKDGFPLFMASERVGFVEVTTSEGNPAIRLKFSEHAAAGKAAVVCNNAARALCKGDTVSRLEQELDAIQKSVGELEEMLNPLALRPLILKTRCILCPV
jgi:hypothetical protein